MRMEEYNKLPDRVSAKELQNMFEDILKKYENETITKEEFLNIADILTERQVFTYEHCYHFISAKPYKENYNA